MFTAVVTADHRRYDGADSARLLGAFAENLRAVIDQAIIEAGPTMNPATDTRLAAPSDGAGLGWLRTMLLIRRFEERAEQLTMRGKDPRRSSPGRGPRGDGRRDGRSAL